MRAVARPFAVALALAVLLSAAPSSDAAEGWAAVGIQVREGRRPAPGVEVRMWPETASTAEAGALATGVTDGEGRAVLYVRPGIWRLELSTGERVDYFVTVRVVPGRRAEELGSPARDVNAPDLRWRYFLVDEPPPLELPAPIRREEPAVTEPPPEEPAAATAPAEEPTAPQVGDETPPADTPRPPAEPDSVVPPPVAPPADPVTEEPPPAPVAPEGSAPEAEPSEPADEAAEPTPSDSSPFDTLPRPASPYDPPPAPAPVEEEEDDAAPVPDEPVQPPATVPPAEEEEPEVAEPPEPPEPAVPSSEEPAPNDPAPAVPAPPELPVEEPAEEEGTTEEAVQPPVRDRLPEARPVGEAPPVVPPAPLPDPAPAVPPAAVPPAVPAEPEPVEPELPPAPPRFAASSAGECPDCRDDEASVVVERTVSPGGGSCGSEIAAAALDAARRLGGGASGPRSLDGASVARWTGGEGCQLLGVVLPAGAHYRGYRYEVEGGAAAGRCYAGSECPVAGAVWPDRPVIRPLEGGETLVYGLFRNTSVERSRRARLTVYYLP